MVFIKDISTDETVNMFVQDNYTFNASALTTYQFEIICSNTLKITGLRTNWNIISLPFNQSISKTDIIVEYNDIIYSWQEAVDNEIVLGFIYTWTRKTPQHYDLTNTLKPGYGYWVYAYKTCTILADGVSTKNNDGYITNMLTTWNIVGLPDIIPLAKEELIVKYQGVYYSWNNATTNNNPTGGPIILGYIYNWSRPLPQHYELSNVFDPGYGYQMYAYYNCSLYYTIIGSLNRSPIGSKENVLEQSSLKGQNYEIQSNTNNKNWNVRLEFKESGNAYDNAIFGEKTDASDLKDRYDVPKNPSGMSPFIHVFFETSCSSPYDRLWEEYKPFSNNNKVWNLIVQWVPSDHSSQTTITISWDKNSFNNCQYHSIILYDMINNINVVDMLVNEHYSFTCPASVSYKFKIICSTNQPPIIPSSPNPNAGAIDVDTNVMLSWSGGDPDSDDTVTYDIYFGKTSTPPNIINNQFEKTCNPGKLENNTIYYWQIISHDSNGALTSGPIWSFTTKKSNTQESIARYVTLNSVYTTQKLFTRKMIFNRSLN